MPDEFKGLVDELLGGDDSPEPEAPAEPEGDADPAEPEDAEPEDDGKGEEEPPKDDGPDVEKLSEESAQSKADRAFAEMRVKNSKYEKALKKAADLSGLTVDQFLEQMETKTLEKKAKTMGTDPELLKRLESLEAENENYRTTQVQMHLTREFGKVEETLGLSKKETQEFATELIKRGHNFNDMSTDYTLLYRGMYHDKLVEKERQSWIERQNKAKNSATPVGKPGRRDDSPDKIESMADLEKLLNQIEE